MAQNQTSTPENLKQFIKVYKDEFIRAGGDQDEVKNEQSIMQRLQSKNVTNADEAKKAAQADAK